MTKKIAGIISVIELFIAVIMYFVIARHFNVDPSMMPILANITFESTLLRLMIYIVPGINIICGLFGIVFSSKSLLVFMGMLEIACGLLTNHYRGQNEFMSFMAVLMIVLGILFIICVLLAKTDDKKEIR